MISSSLYAYPDESNRLDFQLFSCLRYDIQDLLKRFVFVFSNLYELPSIVQMAVGNPELCLGKCFETCFKDLKFPAHHMNRLDILLTLLGCIRFF